jgi:hypothetical protein
MIVFLYACGFHFVFSGIGLGWSPLDVYFFERSVFFLCLMSLSRNGSMGTLFGWNLA